MSRFSCCDSYNPDTNGFLGKVNLLDFQSRLQLFPLWIVKQHISVNAVNFHRIDKIDRPENFRDMEISGSSNKIFIPSRVSKGGSDGGKPNFGDSGCQMMKDSKQPEVFMLSRVSRS